MIVPDEAIQGMLCLVSPFRYPGLKLYHLRLPRQLNGRFKNKDVADVLQQATARSACAFGHRQVPLCAQDLELQKIKEARDSNMRSLNDYRKCPGLKRMSCVSLLRVLSFFFPDIAHKTFMIGILTSRSPSMPSNFTRILTIWNFMLFLLCSTVTDIFRSGWATCRGSGSMRLWVGLHNGNLVLKFTTLNLNQIHKDVWSFNGSRKTLVFL